MDTLKRIVACEDVVGGNLGDTTGEEDETPCDGRRQHSPRMITMILLPLLICRLPVVVLL